MQEPEEWSMAYIQLQDVCHIAAREELLQSQAGSKGQHSVSA